MKFSNRLVLTVSALVFSAFILRVVFLPGLSLTFGYDQARDAFIARQIAGGELKVLGPPASTPGIHHGVFYYYFLAAPYIISANPIVAAYWNAVFNSLTVVIVFFLGMMLTGKRSVGLLSALLFSVSFEATQYATWLSNPTLGVWTVPLLYLGLWLWLSSGKRAGVFLAALGLGLSVQAEVFLLYHALPVAIWIFVARRRIRFTDFVLFVSVFITALSSMIISEIKFGFRGMGGAVSLLQGQDAVLANRQFGDYIILYLNQLGIVFTNNLFPLNVGYGGMFGFGLVVWAVIDWFQLKRRQIFSWQLFLVSYILSHSSVVSVGGVSTPFLMVGIGSAIVVLAAAFLDRLRVGNTFLFTVLISALVTANVITILSENQKGQTIFSIQKEMTLSRQLPAVDYTYRASEGKPFTVNTITSPLWVNNVWAYLYSWYGQDNYGYLPQWHGRDQVGQLGDILSPKEPDTSVYYLIMEPLQGIPPKFVDDTIVQEDAQAKVIEEKNFGQIIVQKREVLDAN